MERVSPKTPDGPSSQGGGAVEDPEHAVPGEPAVREDVPMYVAIAAVFNGLVVLLGPLVVAFHIMGLEDQFEFAKSGGDYAISWWTLVGGMALYMTGLVVTAGPPRRRYSASVRRLVVAAFTCLQLGFAIGAYYLSPQQPWS